MRNKNLIRIIEGSRQLIHNKKLIIIPVIYIVLVVIAWHLIKPLCPQTVFCGISDIWSILLNILMWEALIIGLLCILMFLETPLAAKRIEMSFKAKGFYDKNGNTPILLSKTKKPNVIIYEFYSPILSKDDFVSIIDSLRTILEGQIEKDWIKEGRTPQYIIVEVVSSKKNPEIIPWDERYLSNEEFVFNLGENSKGKFSINLLNVNSILIAGASGSGKSILVRLILLQAIRKNALVILGDFKGGLDYTGKWKKQCNLITDKEKWADKLDEIVDILHERMRMLNAAECENIANYNQINDSKLNYYIICCDEVSELLDKSGLTSKDPKRILIERIENSLSTLARLGRSAGISLLLATQVPSREIINGQIISNMNLKIVGKADTTLSTMVLGNGDADKKIPKDKNGFFLTNTGVLFKGYYVDKNSL